MFCCEEEEKILNVCSVVLITRSNSLEKHLEGTQTPHSSDEHRKHKRLHFETE